MTERSRTLYCAAATFLVGFILACGLTVMGQSGRRPKNPAPAPVPSPAATPEAVRTTTKSTDEKTMTLIVGIDRFSDVSDVLLSFYTNVLSSCAERLDDAKSVKVEPTSNSMSRADAIKRAKDEPEAFVVSLQLRSTSTRVGTQMTRDLNDVYIEYSVFAPTTGKVVASGQTYQRDKSFGGVVRTTPTGRNSTGDHDYWLKQAARAAAEKILASFRIHVPGGPLGLQY